MHCGPTLNEHAAKIKINWLCTPSGPPWRPLRAIGVSLFLGVELHNQHNLCLLLTQSLNAAGSRLCFIKELLFTTKLCLSQVSSPQALLDCHLPRREGLWHKTNTDMPGSQPGTPTATWHRRCCRARPAGRLTFHMAACLCLCAWGKKFS